MELDCIATTKLLSARLDRRLPERARRELAAHLALCPACERCALQFRRLRELVRRWRR